MTGYIRIKLKLPKTFEDILRCAVIKKFNKLLSLIIGPPYLLVEDYILFNKSTATYARHDQPTRYT